MVIDVYLFIIPQYNILQFFSGPLRFLPTFDPPATLGAHIGETVDIGLEIYGFPEPRALTLLKGVDSVDLTSSPRHSVKYTAREAPLGFVNMTISDIVETDFTNYILVVDNWEEKDLLYSLYLYKGEDFL